MTPSERNRLTILAYFGALQDGNGDALFALYDPAVVQTEWPNALKPEGGQRGLEQMRADFERGKAVLRGQTYELKSLVSSPDTVAVEAVWTGVMAVSLGRLNPGDTMTAHIATVFTLKNGHIISQRNYDCFDPF